MTRQTKCFPGRGRGLSLAIAAAAAIAAPASSFATEGGNSAYVIGAQTFRQGSLGEGFQLQTFSVFYDAAHFRDGKGGDRFADFSTSVGVQAFRLSYTLPDEIAGFKVGFAVLQPFFYIDTYRKPPGSVPATHGHDTGPTDTLVTPLMLSNDFELPLVGHVEEALKLTVNTPDGDYDRSKPINVGHHYWAYLPTYGIEMHPNENYSFGVNVTWLINETNHATNYRSGQETVTEFSLMRKVDDRLSLGLNGYYYRQITADKQNGAIVNDGFYGKAIAIGPQLQYHAPFGNVTMKWQPEFDVRNRPDGNRLWLQLQFRI
jgi:hypothetical protein